MAVLFLGAGASYEFDIPLPTMMTKDFEDRLNKSSYQFAKEKELYRQVLGELKDYPDLDIEAVITVLEHIIQPQKTIDWAVSHPSIFPILGISWHEIQRIIDGRSKMYSHDAASLLREIKAYMLEVCSITLSPGDSRLNCFRTLFNGIWGIDYDHDEYPPPRRINPEMEIFTTNYDRILERYCELIGWIYNNGEGVTQSRGGELNLGAISSTKGCRIHKLHGTINWYEDAKTSLPHFWPTIPRPGERDVYGGEIGDNLLIFPTKDWYTFREPFYPLFHDLKRTLVSSEKQCIIVGYSLRDEDIAGLLLDAAKINRKLTFCLIDPEAEKIKAKRLGGLKDKVYPITKLLREVTIDDLERYNTFSR